MTKHCETCVCDEPESLDYFNRRCMKLASILRAQLNLPAALVARLGTGRYALGFTGFKASAGTAHLAGQFLASLYPVPFAEWVEENDPAPLLFYVNTLGPLQAGFYPEKNVRYVMIPQARQYTRGDAFDIRQSPDYDDIILMAQWDDEKLSNYLGVHLAALRDRIEAQ